MIKYLLAFVFGAALCATAFAQQVPHPAPMSLPKTNTELKAINGGINLRAARLGFTSAGDGGYAEYNWSASNCTAADDGAQVQPGVTGCWIADFSSAKPTPKVWGAVGDGTTNDTVAVQKAVVARYRQTLYIGPYRYCIGSPGIIIQKPIALVGDTPGNRYQMPISDQYGFTACTTNIEMLKFTNDGTGGTNAANGSELRSLYIEAGSAGLNTSGAAVMVNPASNMRMADLRINRACIALDLQLANSVTIDSVEITSKIPGGETGVDLSGNCGGIRVGHGSTLGGTVAVRISNTTSNVAGGYGILVEDAGGLFIGPNVDMLAALNGTVIKPALANQQVTWLTAHASSLADTTCSTGLVINTTVATNKIQGLNFDQTWTSSAGNTPAGCLGAGVDINNSGGGYVSDIRFTGHRSYANGVDGFLINPGVQNISINNSSICNNGVTYFYNTSGPRYAGITLAAGASGVTMNNNRIGKNCIDTLSWNDTQGVGIYLYGTNTNITAVGNDLRDNVLSPLAATVGLLPTGSNVFRDNLGEDDVGTNIAAAATLALPMGTNIAITGGTTTITNITGMWNGRVVNLFFTGAGHTFTAGSGICNAKTVAQFDQVVAYRMPGAGCTYLR